MKSRPRPYEKGTRAVKGTVGPAASAEYGPARSPLMPAGSWPSGGALPQQPPRQMYRRQGTPRGRRRGAGQGTRRTLPTQRSMIEFIRGIRTPLLTASSPASFRPACRYLSALPDVRPAARHFLTRKLVILMSTGIIVVIVVAVIVVAALVTGVMAIMRRRRLQQRFGPEYPARPLFTAVIGGSVVVLLQTLVTGCGRDQPGCMQGSGAFFMGRSAAAEPGTREDRGAPGGRSPAASGTLARRVGRPARPAPGAVSAGWLAEHRGRP